MSAEQVTPPAVLAVPLQMAFDTLRLEGDEATAMTPLITLRIKANTRAGEHNSGRCFVHQGWQVTLDRFYDSIRLERSPLASVESVRFYDTDGVEQTLDPSDYIVDLKSAPGFIVPAPDKAWPCTQVRINAVTVDYTVGYGPGVTTVPEEAQNYILACLQIQHDPASKVTVDDMDGLLDPIRCYG